MQLKELVIILKRLYREYIKIHFKKIILALFLSLIVAGSTSATAWLLDPAVKKIFVDQDKTLAWLIPIFIVLALFGVLIVLSQGSAVAPFIYTIF